MSRLPLAPTRIARDGARDVVTEGGGMAEEGGPSIYRSQQAAASLLRRYDAILDRWPVAHVTADVAVSYGTVHVNVAGPESGVGPMGITPLGLPAVMRMMAVSMFPSESRIARTRQWAVGSSPAVSDPYGAWFAEVLRSVAAPPRVGRPKPLTAEEMGALQMPVLLILGDGDNLVGDPGRAAKRAAAFPDIETDVVKSAHLVNVEQADSVNRRMIEFLEDGA